MDQSNFANNLFESIRKKTPIKILVARLLGAFTAVGRFLKRLWAADEMS